MLIDNGIGYYLDWQWALRQQGHELAPAVFWEFMNKHELVGAPNADKAIVQFCCALVGHDCADKLVQDKNEFSRALHARGFPSIEATVCFLKQLSQNKKQYDFKIGLASGGGRKSIIANKLCF